MFLIKNLIFLIKNLIHLPKNREVSAESAEERGETIHLVTLANCYHVVTMMKTKRG